MGFRSAPNPDCFFCKLHNLLAYCQSGRHGRETSGGTKNSWVHFLDIHGTFLYVILKCRPFELAIKGHSHYFCWWAACAADEQFPTDFLLKVWKNIIITLSIDFLRKVIALSTDFLMESYLSPKWAKIGPQIRWQIVSWLISSYTSLEELTCTRLFPKNALLIFWELYGTFPIWTVAGLSLPLGYGQRHRFGNISPT
jgi:hypothetical protein